MKTCAYCGAATTKTLCVDCVAILDAAFDRRKPADEGLDFDAPHFAPARNIIAKVAAHYGLSEERLVQRSRQGDQAPFARRVCMYLLANLSEPKLTLNQIGALMGGRDHTTVLYARDTIAGQMAQDKNFAEVMRLLAEECNV